MNFSFKNLDFSIEDSKIKIINFGGFTNRFGGGFAEVHIAGENKATHEGIKLINSSEGKKLKYVSHKIDGNVLCVVEQSELICAETRFISYDDTPSIRIITEIKNISNHDIVIEDMSSIVIYGLSSQGTAGFKDLYFTRFIQSHHNECQPLTKSFEDYGFISYSDQAQSQKRVSFANTGSWSTKEELPQGIIEDKNSGRLMMFQIESASSWYYEMSDCEDDVYLYLGGANSSHSSWHKILVPGEVLKGPSVAICTGTKVHDVLSYMTKYRRHIAGIIQNDRSLPTIYNEYMHNSWDSPTEEKTVPCAKAVAKAGIEYYVIDCGWHDEVPANIIYHYVGKWQESKTRFPNGLRATADFIHSLGMKFGLWIEPEIVGIKCKEMLDYYDDDCFYTRYGKRIAVHDRYFLDYRHPKVIAYMSETIRRMVEDYGADYIKFDYNQDCGTGTDFGAEAAGEGLRLCTNAFFDWIESMKKKFPNVIFEGCASGGMRMDYASLSTFSLVSTSDQTDYLKYPYIAANILSAVIPEQAAVWSYPVAWLDRKNISPECTAMNMINSFLGRMHLASHIDWLDEKNYNLVKTGVEYFKSLSPIKPKSTPYMPHGFSRFGQEVICSGLKHNNMIYLAVWNLGKSNKVEINLDVAIKNTKIAYPSDTDAKISIFKNKMHFDDFLPNTAVFMEIELP